MFLARRPSAQDIDRFLDDSRELPLSYHSIGMVREKPRDRACDEEVVVIGHGKQDFERARAALMTWKQFEIGWVETFPPQARRSDDTCHT